MSGLVRINVDLWRAIPFLLLLLLVVFPGMVRIAVAHDVYTAFIQHRVHLSVGAGRLDVTVDLTFFEEWSSRERRRIDTDRDGHLQKTEVDAYEAKLARELADKARLRVAGRDIPLVPLYEPEMDLLGDSRAGPAHGRLRLFFFAPDGPSLKAGDELEFTESFWSEAKALVALELEGRDGCVLEPAKPKAAKEGSHELSKGISFRIRCVKPPQGPGSLRESQSHEPKKGS